MASQSNIDVVYIGGSGRSGSTLLNQVLGAPSNHCAIGELSNIWQRSFIEDRRCDCGETFRQCAFWQDVVAKALGPIDDVDVDHIIELFEATQRGWHLPMFAIRPIRRLAFRNALTEYASLLESLYLAIAEVSGCEVIIDSSKAPSHAYAIAEIPGIRARMVHLVRDSRATAYSWQRKKRRIDVLEKTAFMAQQGSIMVSAHWVLNHVFTPLAARRFQKRTICRYEDFAASPRSTVARLATDLDLDDSDIPFVSEREVAMPSDHALWGNPSRFERGQIEIKPDEAWREAMCRWEKLRVTALTFPLLVRYRYLGR